MKVKLRDYQSDQRGVQGIRASFASGKKWPLYVLPTGGGKTPISAFIIESAYNNGKTVYFLVHRAELLMQASRHLYALGVPHGRIAPGHSRTKDRIQVASVQTLINRLNQYAPPDLIIIDEGHHIAATWRKIIEYWPNAKVLGVTATPRLLSGKGLGRHAGGFYDDMVLGPPPEWLMSNGWLTRAEVYAPETALDLSDIKIVGGDYARGELGRRVDKPTITGSAVEHYKKICPGTPAIAFCASVAHAQHVAEQFRAAGFRSISLDGTLSDEERKKAIEDLGNGRLDVLTSCMIISEGTDIPVVGAAILLRPTMSLSLHLQQMGRVLRPVWPAGFDPNTATPEGRLAAIARSGKPTAIILDHVGNTMRPGLGLPEEDREWSLDGAPPKKRKKKAEEDEEETVKIKQCPKCYRCHKPALVCPSCGHTYEIKTREVAQVEGKLVKVDKAALAAARKLEIRQAAKDLAGLVAYAKSKNYAKGWVKKQAEFRHMTAEYTDPAEPDTIKRRPVQWADINSAWNKGA